VSAPRRRVLALAVGCGLAAILAVVLFVGVGTGSQSTGSTSVDPAPGIDQAAAQLLELNAIPAGQAKPAPPMKLVDQHGRPASLAQFKGKTVIWSLEDDRCTDLCPLFAQTVVAAERDLGPAAQDVVFVAVNANPFYTDPSYVLDWSTQNDVEALPNWYYLTGTPQQLQRTWSDYKVTVLPDARTRTVTHDAILEFIDPAGSTRAVGYFSQGAISTAYYAHVMAQMAVDLLPTADQVKVGGPDVDTPDTRGASIGDRAPAFDLQPLNGAATGLLSGYERRPLVLNFWASTCSPCTTEMPALERVEKDYGSRVGIVGVDVADPRTAAARFVGRLGVTYPLLADPQGATAADYRVTALPVTFVVAPGGAILARHDGTLTASELEAVLQMDFQQLNPP
jgi:cytochrome oxidase Cu insertion factor (SCO1/SenC/PrrC family)/peroxiredoxin